jgi:hypothetical protein
MEQINLTIREVDNFVIPNTDNEIQRRKELRARTLLAYGYDQGIFKPFETAIDYSMKLVILDRIGNAAKREINFEETSFALRSAIFTGRIEVADSITAGWSEQPCKLMLLVKHETNVDLLLRHYFQTPLRWLNDQSHAKYAIAAAVESL